MDIISYSDKTGLLEYGHARTRLMKKKKEDLKWEKWNLGCGGGGGGGRRRRV